MYRKKTTSGFSLTELLVAMALMVTVMSGITMLYQGAIRTIRQGEIAREAAETARTTMDILQRDLETAFTNQELGRQNQFYGGREGFMFVGQGETEKGSRDVGRITWFIRTQPDSKTINTTMGLLVEDIFVNIYHQIKRQAVDQGMLNDAILLSLTNDALIAFADLHMNVLDAGEYNDLLVYISALFEEIDAMYIDFSPTTALERDAIFQDAARFVAAGSSMDDFQVAMQTYSLSRYSQRVLVSVGVRKFGGDLDTLDLAAGMRWPHHYPNYYWSDHPESTEIQKDIHEWFIGVTNPSMTNGFDLRDLINDDIGANTLNRINYEATTEIYNAAKREFWLRMLSGDPYYQDWYVTRQSIEYWDNNGIGAIPRDYVVAENILRRAILIDPATDEQLFINISVAGVLTTTPDGAQPLDLLDVPPLFQYVDDDGTSQWYNSRFNIPGYGLFLVKPDLAGLREFDDILLASEGHQVGLFPEDYGYSSWEAARVGSPLDPKMPTKVKIGFYLVHDKPGPGDPDFRRWYEQTINVPSGQKRSVPAELRAEAR